MAKRYVTVTTLNEAVEAILNGMQSMFDQQDKKRQQDKKEILDYMDTRFKHQKDDMDGLRAELSNTPSRREFEELKKRIQKLERALVSN